MPELEKWVVASHLAAVGGQLRPLGLSWFKALRDTVVAEGIMDERGAKPECLWQVVRGYFNRR